MKQKLQFRFMIKGIMTLSLFFVGCLVSVAHVVTHTNSNPTMDMLTISDTESIVNDATNADDYSWQTCTAEGGKIQIAGTTDVSAEICVGEGVVDGIDVEFYDMSVLSGDNSTYVITDNATGDILALPPSVPSGGFVLEGAGPGVCDIWYLRYEDGLTGLATGNNVSGLSGCFDLSNAISVTRNAVNGGAIQIAGTTDTTAEICVGEGVVDAIDVEFDESVTRYGTNASWVITDQATGDILALPPSVPSGGFVLEGAGPGVCDIWYLRYEDGLTGLATGNNVSGLSGCFDLSNAISVTRNAVNGGAIQIAGTTDTTAEICVGEGVVDAIDVEFDESVTRYGTNASWVITDQATGDILALPPSVPSGGFVLEGAGPGVCDIWYLRYEDGLTGLATGNNVSGLSGCFDLSNAISVTRNAVNGGAIQIAGTTDTTAEICVGEGVVDAIDVEFDESVTRYGTNASWVITDQATGDILALPPSVPSGGFVLEGAGPGVCDIWYLRYEDGLTGLATGNNVSGLSGCFDLSNAISVTRNAVNGGAIQIAGTTDTTAEICVGEGVVDAIDVEFDESVTRYGTNASWVITDQATGDILALPPSVPSGGFVLEGAGPGVCDIWYLRYEDGLTGLATGNNVSGLSGCFDLSNAISVTRNAVNGGAIQIAGTTDTTAEICVGEGVVDAIDVEFDESVTRYGTNASWVITDQATGDILALPPSVPSGGFVLEGAGPGVCDIWYLRYEDGLTGLATGNNVSGLSGCFDLSNAISVTRLTGSDCSSLSVDEFDSAFDFDFYPNPTRDNLTIVFGGNRTLDIEIQVIDMLGKQVYRSNVSNQNNAVINISHLEDGAYFMNITDLESGSRIVKRVIKN